MAVERFLAKVNKCGPLIVETRCWSWTAYRNKCGYGTFQLGPSQILAHRASWKLHNGAFDESLNVLHRCDNPSCVNPDHLFLGTHQENMADCKRKKRFFHSSKTHCRQGHPYDEKNTRFNKKGERVCKVCAYGYELAYDLRKKRLSQTGVAA